MIKEIPVVNLIELQQQVKEIHNTTHVIDVNADCVLVTQKGMKELKKRFPDNEIVEGEPFNTMEIEGVKFQCLRRVPE